MTAEPFPALQAWRQQVLQGILYSICGFGLLAGAAAIVRGTTDIPIDRPGQLALTVGGSVVVYAGLVLVTLVRRLGYALRAGITLGLTYSLGVFALTTYGLNGNGTILLFVFVVLSAVLFNWRWSLAALLTGILTEGVVATGFLNGWLGLGQPVPVSSGVVAWVSAILTFTALGTAVTVSIAYLLTRLSQAVAQEQAEHHAAQRAQEKLTFLAEASETFSGSLSSERALQHLAHLAVPRLADACVAALDDETGQVQAVAAAHRDSDPRQTELVLERFHTVLLREPALAALEARLDRGETIVVPVLDENSCARLGLSAAVSATADELGLRAAASVPIMRPASPGAPAARRLGAALFGWRTAGVAEAELPIIEDLVRRAALAIESGRLYEAAQAAHQAATRAADRTARLQVVTAGLARSLSIAEATDTVLEQGVAALSARAGLLRLVSADGQALNFTGATGELQALGHLYPALPMTEPTPNVLAVRRRAPVVIASLDGWVHGSAAAAATAALTGRGTIVAVPLLLEGDALGVISIHFHAEQAVTGADVAFLEALAGQAAQAVARARLFESEQRSRSQAQAALAALEVSQAQLQQANDELFLLLAKIIDARDPYVASHATKVADYALAIGAELGLPPGRLEPLRQAALLHDIGKIGITEQVLNKPAKLTPEEYELVKPHVTLGAELLMTCAGLRHLAPFVRYHHERWDGQGYPDRLAGEAIPLEARILGVCDAVEAMASDRPYQQALTVNEIIAEVERCAGRQFDPTVAATFVRIAAQAGDRLITNSALRVGRRSEEALG